MSDDDDHTMFSAPLMPRGQNLLAVTVIDGSSSMAEPYGGNPSISKDDAVAVALANAHERLRNLRGADLNDAAQVVFGDTVRHVAGPAPWSGLGSVRLHPGAYGDAFISAGIEAALALANEYLATADADYPSSVRIVVISDGKEGDVFRRKTDMIATTAKTNRRIGLLSVFVPSIDADGSAKHRLGSLDSHGTTETLQTLEEAAPYVFGLIS